MILVNRKRDESHIERKIGLKFTLFSFINFFVFVYLSYSSIYKGKKAEAFSGEKNKLQKHNLFLGRGRGIFRGEFFVGGVFFLWGNFHRGKFFG